MSNRARAVWKRLFSFTNSTLPHPQRCVAETLEDRVLLAAQGLITTPQTFTGRLDGKIVFTSGGHGWQYNTTLGRYATDRGDNNEMVEDFGNQEQMSAFADYALRAGATVVPMRPVGRQINEVVLDNDSADVTFSTSGWSNSSSTKYYDENYNGDAVPYRFASTVTGAASATATYTPNIPAAGMYPVYTWVLWGTDRTEQTYTINHTGGSTEITVDHSKVGSGWVYLGTYHFDAGKSTTGEGSVVITNKSALSGKVVIADAIRFGNGMGDYIFTGSGATAISGYPREDENAYHWLARSLGVGTTASSVIGTSSSANVSAPSDYAEYMFHGTFGEAVYIGFHSNAGGGRGARGLIDADVPEQTPHQAGTNGLADILGDQINQDMQNLNGVFEYNWTTGTTSTFTGQFGEINLGSGAEMDATIIEVAFHDSVEDAAIMRDPRGRDQIARSVYQGTVQYFSLYGSPVVTNTSLPTPPTNVRALSNASGAVTLNWSAGPTSPSSVYGNAATGYKVYASVDGYGFDGGRVVAGVGTTSLTITGLDPSLPYYFKVVATNAGGESGSSEVATALPSGGVKQVLIVNGFDRYDRTQNLRYAYLGQQVDRVWPRFNNSFDYVVQFETAIQGAKPGVHVASTSNEAVISGAINLSDFHSVIWILGDESTADRTFDATEQTKVTNFINAGGNFFLSGSEIGWDLDQQNNGRTFYESTLKGNYVSDDAGTYTATAAGGGIFSGMSSFVFSNGTTFSSLDGQYHDVAFPDVIAPQAGAVSALTYSGGTGGTAAIQVAGTGGRGDIVMFGFPFEAMTVAARRQTAMGKILDFFGVTNSASSTPGMPLLAAATNSGSPSDNTTNYNNSSAPKALEITVPGTIAGSTVNVFADGTLIGTATASGTSTTVTATLLNALAEGLHLITAEQFTPGTTGTSAKATNLSITIDTVAPALSSDAFAFQTSQNLTFTFNENLLSAVPTTNLTLHNNTISADLDQGSFSANTTGAVVTFSFPGFGGTLPNGNYTATLSAANITDVAGNALASNATSNFFFMNADADRNGIVNIQDFNVLATNFGKFGQTFTQGNFDYSGDGSVNIQDFNILATNFGKSVDTNPPAAPSTLSETTTASSFRSGHSIGIVAASRRSTARDSYEPQDDLLDDVLL
jgi:hypothetical protein